MTPLVRAIWTFNAAMLAAILVYAYDDPAAPILLRAAYAALAVASLIMALSR